MDEPRIMNRKYDCLFADDIRNEIGGKHSIIGVYNTVLSLDSAQTLIPKLAISLNCYTDFDHPFKQLFVMVMLDDAVISQNELPAQFLEKSFNENKKMIEECGIPLASQFYRATANIHLNPLVIKLQAILKVVVVADGEEKTVGNLILRVPAQQEQPTQSVQ
ncbi:hypothetical protein [Oxalobacter formigenes]|nr:hypothetical protein [Oxalobacter formigenes]QDX32799.1 hypothetical protein FPZ51_03965 [Oxalobacter formigenes]